MKEPQTDLRSELATALEASPLIAHDDPKAHPEIDTLIAYHGGTLPVAEAKGIEDHLVACASCRESLLDLEGFIASPASGPEAVLDLETAAVWRDLRTRMSEPTATSLPTSEKQPPARPSTPSTLRPSTSKPWQALAAAMTLACLGLGGWTRHQQSEIKELAEDLANPLFNQLVISLMAERGRDEPFPAGARGPGRFEFPVAISTELTGFDRFELTVLAGRGTPEYKHPVELAEIEYGLSVAFPSLLEDRYEFTLHGLRQGEWEVIVRRVAIRQGN